MDSNRTQLAYTAESVFGEVPATPPWLVLRLTGEDFKAEKETVVSAEIRADRQTTDLAKVDSGAGGGFKYELSYGAFSPLIAAALGTTATVVNQASPMSLLEAGETLTKDGLVKATVVLTGTGTPANNSTVTLGASTYTAKTALTDGIVANEVLIGGSLAAFLDNLKAAVNNAGGVPGTDYGSATVANATVTATTNSNTQQTFEAITGGTAGNSIVSTEVSAALSFPTTTFTGGQAATWAVTPLPGQYLRVSGFTTPANNGLKLVVAATTSVITFAAGSFTVDEPNVTATIVGTAYRNGILLPTFSVERKTVNNASADFYQRYTGMGVNEWTLSIATAKINEGTFSFMGATALTDNDAVAGATYAAAATNQVQNATSHVGTVYMGGVVAAEHITALEFSVNNNLRSKKEIGRDGAFELGSGEFTVTGKVNVYFADNVLYAAMIAHDYSAVAFTTTDAEGNSMGFHFPRISFQPADPNATAKNTDLMLELPFQAIMDPTLGYTMIVTEMPAAA